MKFETVRPLREIAEIQTGPFGSQLHKEDYVENGTPIVTVEHLGNRVFTEQNLPKVSDEDRERLNKYVLKTGDIVFSRVGSVDRCSYVDEEHNGWMFSGRCLRVRATTQIDPLYLYYFFCLESTRDFVRNIAVGATMPSINTKLLGEVPVSIPDLDTQKAIATVLSAIDDKIELNNKINENLEQQALELFSNYQKASDKKICFTDVIQILGGGTPRTKESAYWDGDIPFFTPKDVGCPYTISTEKTITEDGLNHCNSRLYPVNTVFVTARGTVGKVSMPGVPMAMNQSCYALVGKNLHQLMVYFYTLATVKRLKHKASGAVFDAITTKDFSSEYINRLSEQDEKFFLKLAEPTFQMMLSNIFENKKLENMRDTLLPKLMSGEIKLD